MKPLLLGALASFLATSALIAAYWSLFLRPYDRGMDGFDLSQSFGNEILSIPFSVVLDRTGRIRHRHLGVVSPEQLREWIPPLLAEPVAP